MLALLALSLAAPVPAEVQARDPIDGSVRDYRGVPLLSLVPAGAGGDALLVHCEDGFVALLPLDAVRRYGPVVADEVRGARGWEPIPAPRGPRFLVWPNVAHPELDRDSRVTSEGWAWAVATVEAVSYERYLAPLSPRGVRLARGRALWLASCFHCHAVHGAGGMAGWDLSEPVPLWRYLTEPQIARYLRDPRAVNPDGHMPAQQLDRRERAELFAFLHAVVR
ncbi:MAG TPA: c-type cytochrome [Myxococcales bacterium]|nr:c-type cytochrome [Myxococcales bacterium]